MIVSCDLSYEEPVYVQPYEGVHEDLVPFFKSFEEEASKHGIYVDLTEERVSASFGRLTGPAGSCDRRSNGTRHITIDVDSWSIRNQLGREDIIFHELGHCALLRGHKEDVTPNNVCLSMMRSGLAGCWMVYDETTRETYLEELFNPSDD